MKVILLNRIGKLGALGDQVEVKNGYARNFLIPKKLAVRATKENIAYFESQRVELEKQVADELQSAQARAAALEGTTITMTARAEDNKLYGSIGTKEIAQALCDEGKSVEKKEVCLPKGAIREIGEHEVQLQLYSGVFATIKVVINPQ